MHTSRLLHNLLSSGVVMVDVVGAGWERRLWWRPTLIAAKAPLLQWLCLLLVETPPPREWAYKIGRSADIRFVPRSSVTCFRGCSIHSLNFKQVDDLSSL